MCIVGYLINLLKELTVTPNSNILIARNANVAKSQISREYCYNSRGKVRYGRSESQVGMGTFRYHTYVVNYHSEISVAKGIYLCSRAILSTCALPITIDLIT